MSRTVITCAFMSLLFSATHVRAQTRIDVNGEMVNGASPVGAGGIPYYWDEYASAANGYLDGRYDVGASSSMLSVNMENEDGIPDPGTTWPSPGGHSLLLAGSSGAGAYGIQQTHYATPGKVYWLTGALSGALDWGLAQQANYSFDWGIENGGGSGNGMLSSGNPIGSPRSMTHGRFSQAVVATGSQVTAHVGFRSNGLNTSLMNLNVDGVRIYELNAPVYPLLQNAYFDAPGIDISNYNSKGANPVYDQFDAVPGWTPLGGAVGQVLRYNIDDQIKGSGDSVLQFEMFKSTGRMYAFQRVLPGGIFAPFMISGLGCDILADSVDSDARIGIDPTGGLDPEASSVVWSDAAPADGQFHRLTVPTVYGSAMGGATIFLASGKPGGGRSTGFAGAYFDNVGIPIPEPAVAGMMCVAMLCPPNPRRRSRNI